jgi:hypothetical protein
MKAMNGSKLWGRFSIFIALMIISCHVFSQKQGQIIASSSGIYCRVKVSECHQRFDTLEIDIRVEWINENLQPVQDLNSRLLLKKDNVRTSAEGKVTYPDFEQNDYIAFNSSFPFRLLVSKDFSGSGITIDFKFEIKENKNQQQQKLNESQLVFKNPDELAYAAAIDLKQLARAKNMLPEIRLIAPKADAEGNLVVKDAAIDIIGFASDESGINLVLVNSADARLYPDGKFVSSIKLAPGDNEIKISAIDNDGAISEKKIIITCQSFAMASQMLNAGNYYALLIAVEQYEDPKISDLDHSVEDATALYNVLTHEYSFEKERIKLLINPKFEDIVIELDRLNEVITSNDNLLIFFAGHGIWSEQSKVGYWLPADARESNTAKWFRNSTLRDYIGSIQ